ncbi:MFS transporter [Amycolatopsis cynarae]|uniref:MFS transporter n=1 Tax=Amycolatopsis cynarae TaxID=2995223 RepID=A0ABY7B771_9PSEU|nr:MFS transporter [Amycolatopsis sp. HUAS 11-8]WAL68170.1 MFS transporter [Amycolatopsis sp. HUAS 11-8]
MGITPADGLSQAQTAAPSRRGARANPWLTLASVAFGLFMIGLDGSVVAIANPYLSADLNASLAQLQWVTNAYLLALAAMLILGGKLGDRFGRRTFFLIGIAGFTAASIAIGLAGSIEGVIVFRALQGAFGALMMPNTLGLIRAVFPPRKFGMAVGIWATTSSVSTALGPIVGGLLVEHASWEWVFFVNGPIGLAGLVFGACVLPRSKAGDGARRFDVRGVALLAAGMLVLVFGVVKGESWGWGSAATLGCLLLGALVLAAFGFSQKRHPDPLLPMRLFRSPVLTVGATIVALNFFVLLGVIFLLMLYLQNVRGYSAVMAGVYTLPLSLANVVSPLIGARLTERFGPRLTMPLGMALQAGAAADLLWLDTGSSFGSMWPGFVLLGLGVGMVMAAASEAVVGNAPIADAGVAGGLQATALHLGGALGTSVLASVLASRVSAVLPRELAGAESAVSQGFAPVTPAMSPAVRDAVIGGSHRAFVTGLHTAMAVTAAVCVTGAVLSIVYIRRAPLRDLAG